MKLSDIETYSKGQIKALSDATLLKAIERARLLYAKGKSTISDRTYDALEAELKRRDPNNPLLAKVGQKVTRSKVKLPYPLFSLSKFKPDDGKSFGRWKKNWPGAAVVSDKEDGISLELIYKEGKLDKIYTRGDGVIGQDVTHLKTVLDVPRKVSSAGITAIRAELCMSEAAFQKYAAGQYANARNLVAGLTNRINSAPTMLKHADVLAYEVITPRMKPSRGFSLLKKWGFTCAPHQVVKEEDLTLDLLSKLFDRRRKASAHAIDGLVVENDAPNARPPGGTHSPEYAFAFKKQTEDSIVEVKVLGVDWEVSKHNTLVPVIQIPPTQLSGVTITNVTGHNAFFIAHGYRSKEERSGSKAARAERAKTLVKRPIGPGALVKITRSGDVIPHVVEVVKAAKKPDLPNVEFEWMPGNIQIKMVGTSDLQRDKRITAFFDALDVEGVKLGVVQQLTEAGYDSIIKILRADADDFLQIPGFKQRKAEKLAAAIHAKTKAAPLHLLMAGSGHFGQGFGSKRFDAIITAYPNLLTRWVTLTPAQIKAKVSELEGFQDKTAAIFAAGFPKFVRWLAKSRIRPVLPQKVKVTGSALKGQAVCFTGVRDKALEAQIVKNGGTIASGVSAKTTALVSVPGKTSSKLSKAQALGIPVYSIDSFKKKFKL